MRNLLLQSGNRPISIALEYCVWYKMLFVWLDSFIERRLDPPTWRVDGATMK